MCSRRLIKQRTCLVIKTLQREASHADVPLGIRSVFKETHTFQPCVEGKVEVVDFIPRFFITHSHTLYRGWEGEEGVCELGEPGGTVLAKLGALLSLSTPSPLCDRFPRELTPSLRNYSQPWQKAGDACAKTRDGAGAGRLKLPLPSARHHKGGGEIALIFLAI